MVACTLVAYTPNNRFENHVHVGGGHRVGEIPLLMGARLVFGKRWQCFQSLL
jgi:hypothetical protein